ncbi:hypothetical protein HYC85_003624 [Camellia sinensis]|uniref:PGG domain-containing protein n=1 Tax=Camellia sinensis TaxID=4442 RepID=A0A7J7HUS7_CAMSI|nr:hypothetical protein HYC85_003624 [Camellia sinensis]
MPTLFTHNDVTIELSLISLNQKINFIDEPKEYYINKESDECKEHQNETNQSQLERETLKWPFGKVRGRNGCEKVSQKDESRNFIPVAPLERHSQTPARAALTDSRSSGQSPARAADAHSQNLGRQVPRSSVQLPARASLTNSRSSGQSPARASNTAGDKLDGQPRRQKVKAMLWRVLELLVPPIKYIQHIREQKLKHNQALQLVKYLCEQVRSLEDLKAYRSLAKSPLLVAAKLGIHKIIEEIVNSFPRAIVAKDSEDRNIFELAVIKRHENVFNLLYQMGEYKQSSTRLVDGNGNTLLHLVGNQAPIEMRVRLEVEKFVNPSYIEKQNDRGETPSTVFTNKHKDLVVEGEKWMKNRATSCTIATTLITAIVFAAAITVPGGNNNTSGLPNFSTKKAFIIFVVSDAIALFMSTTSLLIFLSILTSRYAQDDFLHVLPHRLIIGFVTLFLSITTMIVAFSSTICLMLSDKNSWLLGLVVTSACLPISSFMLLQFPLLVDLMSSTYGPGIFGKQSNQPFY